MHQLVGCACARCQRTVSSIIDAVFCPTCGNPVHVACMMPAPDEPSKCPRCGGDAASKIAKEVRRERQAEGQRTHPAHGTGNEEDWRCPRCGLVNPAAARVCECGAYASAQQTSGAHAGFGWFATYQIARLSFGAAACGLVGIGLLFWELSESNPSFWGIVRSVLISGFGFGLLAMLVWLWVKAR